MSDIPQTTSKGTDPNDLVNPNVLADIITDNEINNVTPQDIPKPAAETAPKGSGMHLTNYINETNRVLNTFAKAKEWSDFIGLLSSLELVIKKYNTKTIKLNLVCLPLLTKRLTQCLNPVLPNGVHFKCIDVYKTILKILVLNSDSNKLNNNSSDPNHFTFIKTNFYMLFKPFFAFGENCRILVFKQYLEVIERFILPLYKIVVTNSTISDEKLPLKLILLGILPSLESEAADQFEKGYQLMSQLYEYYHIKPEENNLNNLNSNNPDNLNISNNAEQEENNNNFSLIKKSFYLSLYKLFITNSSMRPFILNFMNKHKQSDLDHSSICTYKIQTKAYCVAFEADVITLVRNAFEHTNSMFPLLINEETISDVNDKSNENINADELYNLEKNMTTNTSNTTFEIKKKKDLTHTQNILYDKHHAELLELNDQLRVSAFKTFLKKESGIAKKYIKWIEGTITINDNNDNSDNNLMGMVDNFEFLVNSNLLTNSIKLEIFIKAMVTLGERYSSEFVKLFLRKYFIYILMLLKPHVEKQVQMDKMPLEDIKGIELLKTLKIFIAANWNIYGGEIVEIVKEYFKSNKEKNNEKDTSNISEKKEETSTTSNISSSINNPKDISLDELTSLLSFTIAVFTEFDVNYYSTYLIDLTKIIMSNKLLLSKEVFYAYINIFYTVLELEEVIVRNSNAVKNSNSLYINNGCEYTSFVDKKYVALLAEEVFNIENYRNSSYREKSEEIIYEYDKNNSAEDVLVDNNNSTFAFSNADLSYMVEFHRRFIRVNARTHTRKNKKSEDSAYSAEKKRGSSTTLNNKNVSVTSLQNNLNSKENLTNNDYAINPSFQEVLNAFILSDYSHAYVVHHMFTEKDQLYQKLIDDYSSNTNNNDAFILEYINSSTIDAYINKVLKEESSNSNLLNLLSNNTNNEILIRPMLTFMYYYHSHEQRNYSTYYSTIVSSITKWSVILEGIVEDINKKVNNNEDSNLDTTNSLQTLLSTLKDIFSNTKALKEIKKSKPYHSLEDNNGHVLDKLHKALENVVHNSDETLFELILHLYYLLHVHGFYYKIIDVEILVEKYINSDNSNNNNNLVVKYSAYMLNHDYILNKLLQYHKIILEEYTKKGVASETDTIELVNRMAMASSKYFIKNRDNKVYSNSNNSSTTSLNINNKKYDSQESNSSQHNSQDNTRPNINILVIWTDMFNTVDSKILNKCNLSAIYSKLLNYFISYSINNYIMKYCGHKLRISQSNVFELENNGNNENMFDEDNLTNTSLSSGFISDNLYETSTCNDTNNVNISMDIVIHTTNYTHCITTLSQLLFKYNPVLFIKTLPCDISIVPLFTSYSIKLQNALYGYFLSKYSSDILFLLFNSHLSITSKTIIKSTLIKHKNNSNKLREIDIILLLRIFSSSTVNTIDASMFNLVTNSNVLTNNTLMMLYAAVVGNVQLHKKFVEYLHRRIKKDNGIFTSISEVVLESKVTEKVYENNSNSVTLLNSIIHNTYNNVKYSLFHFKNRNNLLISFARILPTYLMSNNFFVGNLSQKYHTFELLSPYIDTSSIMNTLSYKLDNSFFSGSVPNKIFNIRRISFVLLSTYNYVDNKYLTTISEVIHDLLSSEINLKIELYRMIKVLLVMSKKNNLTNMLLLYPLVVEDMLIAIKSKNIKLIYTIMSVVDITLFMNIEYFDLRVVLKEYTKHVCMEGSDFFIDSNLNHITVNNNNDEKVKHLFSYSERTPAQLLSYAKNALGYYGENNLAFKERDVEGLKKKILEQFEEREN